VVENRGWCMWHGNAVSVPAFSVGERREVSTQGEEDQPAKKKIVAAHAVCFLMLTRVYEPFT
jgi:hypothetical protein